MAKRNQLERTSVIHAINKDDKLRHGGGREPGVDGGRRDNGGLVVSAEA